MSSYLWWVNHFLSGYSCIVMYPINILTVKNAKLLYFCTPNFLYHILGYCCEDWLEANVTSIKLGKWVFLLEHFNILNAAFCMTCKHSIDYLLNLVKIHYSSLNVATQMHEQFFFLQNQPMKLKVKIWNCSLDEKIGM